MSEPETTDTQARPDESAVPWRWWDAVVVFVLAQVTVSLLAGFAAAWLGREVLFPTLIVATSAVSILFTLLWVGLRYPGQISRLFGRVRPSARDVGTGIGVGIVAFLGANVALSLVIQAVMERSGRELPVVQEQLQAALSHPFLGPVVIFSVIVLAPLGEELLFRGLLLTGLRRSLPFWAALVGSAFVFALTHVEWLAVLVIFPVGLLFGWAYHRHGTLVVPIAAHATFNLINVVLLRVGAP